MKTRLLILIVMGLLMLAGCENHYAMVTDEGIVDMPLSKALRIATSPQQLYPVLSEAIDPKDREKIEAKIRQLQGFDLQNEPRHLHQREDYLASQADRRIKYVRGRLLSDEMKKTILSGGVIVGMSKDEFIASRGRPDEVKFVETEQGTAEVFIEGLFDKKSYYFFNGKLEYWF